MVTEHKIFDTQLGMFEALRKLGFESDDIFVSWNHGDPVTILRTQGKEFVVNYGHLGVSDLTEESYISGWLKASNFWNIASDAQRTEIYEDWLSLGMSIPLMLALQNKGMRVPRIEAEKSGRSHE